MLDLIRRLRGEETTREAVLRRVGLAPLPKARDVVKAAERIVRSAKRDST